MYVWTHFNKLLQPFAIFLAISKEIRGGRRLLDSTVYKENIKKITGVTLNKLLGHTEQ